MAILFNENRPTVSVALCTYNGATYLDIQLQSILEQTRLPDELVVCDDQSTDQTMEVLEKFAARASFPVRIIRNTTRLGYNKNFEKALSLCTSELLFICDQDDFWLPEKVEELSTYLIDHPDVDLVFSNAIVVDSELKTTDLLFWDTVGFTEKARTKWLQGEAVEVLLDGNRMMGCASAMRRRFLELVLPVPTLTSYIYDGWFALIAALKGTIHFYEKPLVFYRIHDHQQVGIRSQPPPKRVTMQDRFSRPYEEKLEPLVQNWSKLNELFVLANERVREETPGKKQLRRRLSHFQVRSKMPRNRILRLAPVVQEWAKGNYKRYIEPGSDWYSPYLKILGDLLE